jgi:predicted N-acetyltransferase YhbS
MTSSDFHLRPETPADDLAVEALAAAAFGPGRFARAAYRLRGDAPHERDLSFAAEIGGELIGSVRLTRIRIGDRPALLLGPLVVVPPWKDRGCGRALLRLAVETAAEAGHELIILVGDLPYYAPVGFRRVEPAGAVIMPAPVNPARLLVAELVAGAADGLSGRAVADALSHG